LKLLGELVIGLIKSIKESLTLISFLFLLTLSSCSWNANHKSDINYENQLQIDLESPIEFKQKLLSIIEIWLESSKIEHYQGKEYYFSDILLKKRNVLFFYSDANCLENQRSCTFEGDFNTIYLNKRFFEVPEFVQVAILWHEWVHLIKPDEDHLSCLDPACPESARNLGDCDRNLESAYGIEYQWGKSLLKSYKKIPLGSLLLLQDLNPRSLTEFVEKAQNRICSKFE